MAKTIIELSVSEEALHKALDFLSDMTRRVSAPAATHEEAARIINHLCFGVRNEAKEGQVANGLEVVERGVIA